MAILIAADLTPDEWAAWWPALQAALPHETLLRERSSTPAEQIDIALVANPHGGELQGLPALRLIHSLWAGVEGLLADSTVPVDVPLARMVDPAMTEAMAQTALWSVLGLHRHFFRYAEQQRAGLWRQRRQWRADETPVAVLGLGHMGRSVARRLALNGYPVRGWSARQAEVDGVVALAGDAALPHVLAGARIVVNLLPSTPATRGFFNADTFAQLPRGSNLVNLARGAHVVEADLLAALASGRLAHAVLDVFGTEPLPAGHPFWAHPHITVLPHVAALTDARSAAQCVARNVQALRQGLPLQHLVDRIRGY
ncbi:MAG: 2-hydroxyacid dehydrogenase [Methylibium sp. NZG]|nr:MAG: 2-hydroxyacid dehydrogenase [Methylibium sp. NZG]